MLPLRNFVFRSRTEWCARDITRVHVNLINPRIPTRCDICTNRSIPALKSPRNVRKLYRATSSIITMTLGRRFVKNIRYLNTEIELDSW